MPKPNLNSPISRSRHVPTAILHGLYGAAAGRCEFDGCNKLVIQHGVTKEAGNYAEGAHIVAFALEGPRGASPRPADINAFENLMLLCPECHKLVDDRPDQFSVQTLRRYKADHELRVRRLTEMDKNLETRVVIVKSRIGPDLVEVPEGDVRDALAPFYPDDSHFFTIDLTCLRVESDTFYQAASDTIRKSLQTLFESRGHPQRISLFALAPIPILVYLGNLLSNKIALNLFQRHRDTGDWTWKDSGIPVQYHFQKVHDGADAHKVALLLPLSGYIEPASLPEKVRRDFTLYEIGLEGQTPAPHFLNIKDDLVAFQIKYREAISVIAEAHHALDELHLFPAVPAPVAVACGHELLPKVHPQLLVWDNDKNQGGFRLILTVNGENRL
jgi:hypothetical protein